MGFFDQLGSFAQGTSNGVAGSVTGPVDGLAWLLRKSGVQIPQSPVGGSNWMMEKGLTREPENRVAGLLGEGVGGALPGLITAKAPQIAGGLLSFADNISAPTTLNKQAGVILYHGSKTREPITKVLDDGPFQGIFASTSENTARSHGGAVYRMTIPDDKVMRMGYELPEQSLISAVSQNLPGRRPSDVRKIADMVQSGKGLFEVGEKEAARLAHIVDPGESVGVADWALQRLRGLAARAHGFRAVEMPDEHGISHLVLPGASVRPYSEEARNLARGISPAPLVRMPAAPIYTAPKPHPISGPLKVAEWMRLPEADKAARIGDVVTTGRTSIGELQLLKKYK